MHLQFYGAAGEVTGSCHILTVRGRRLLLDCGLIQGGDVGQVQGRHELTRQLPEARGR